MIRTQTLSYDLASLIRGLYARVASRSGVDPSYVSRVARGERQSETIQAALGREMKRIMELSGNRKNGRPNGHARNGNAVAPPAKRTSRKAAKAAKAA